MAYNTFPSVTRAGVPSVGNDSTQGFVVGSQWTDTSAAPRKIYLCTDASAGAATWVNAGGVTSHPALTTLGWSSSGHTGTQNSVACFDGAGAALNVQATAEGSVLTFTGGVLTFAVFAATVAYVSERSTETYYVDTLSDAAADFVLAGSMI
jgi:hypothetical protein